MPIQVRCPGCGRQFQAADRLAGKQAKCPQCSAAISVPASGRAQTARPTPQQKPSSPEPAGAASSREEAAWYVQTSDGKQHGPMTRADVDRLVSNGRLDSFSRLRHQTWSKWKWAEDLFPQLASADDSAVTGEGPARDAAGAPLPGTPAGESTGPRPRVVTCPDCGKTVSTRASQCPHCGCPATAWAEQGVAARATPSAGNAVPTGDGPAATGEAAEPQRKPAFLGIPWGIASVVASAALLLVIAAAGLGVGWWVWKSHRALSESESQAEALLEQLAPPAEPAPVPPPLSDDEIEAAMQQAADEVAKRLDGEFRNAHSAKTAIERTQSYVDLLQALAQGDLGAIPETAPAEPATGSATPYQSLYDSLYGECLTYVRENVPREEFTPQAVSDAARRWEQEKRSLLEKQLTEALDKHLAPGRKPP